MKSRLLLIAFFGLLCFEGYGQTISAGDSHTLALLKDGTVVAFGLNDYEQCDTPYGLKEAVAIAAGWSHSLALLKDGTVVAWGGNNHNQCDIPQQIQKRVKAISVGWSHSLALLKDGTVVAWGGNNHNQCDIPQQIQKRVKAISAGWSHSLALLIDGTVVAWGSEWMCNVPFGLKEVKAISAGDSHSLALLIDGTIQAWGVNNLNQCDIPQQIQKRVKAISAGGSHSLALLIDGTIEAWGDNNRNQCDVPELLSYFNQGDYAIQISAGKNHSLALTDEGEVVAWGSNKRNQCEVPNGLKSYINSDALELDSKPPILSISDIEFVDVNGNNTIDAFEDNSLTFSLNNTGPGNGSGLRAEVSMSGNIQGIEFIGNHTLATVENGSSINYTIPISSTQFTTDGGIQINVEVIEPKGFSPEPFALKIDTRAFRAPKLEVVDFSSSMTLWEPNTPIGLDLLIQNTGEGTAENMVVELKLPNAVNCYSNNLSVEVTYIAPGETLPITYDMIVPRNFDQNNVTANLTVSEKFGDYGSTWNHNFPFEGGSNGTNVISIEAAEGNESIEIDRASLNTKNNKTADVSFNQVPKDIVVNTVAVLPIEGTGCNGNTLNGQDIASFTEGSLLGIYNVVERRNLERVLDEQKLALSGVLFEKSAVEAGCNVGAQGIIFTEYGCLTGQEVIQLKLVDCQTSELYWSATGVNATAKQVLDKVREELEKD